MQSPDEDDFDQFLENVKARSLSTQKQGRPLQELYDVETMVMTFTLQPDCALPLLPLVELQKYHNYSWKFSRIINFSFHGSTPSSKLL